MAEEVVKKDSIKQDPISDKIKADWWKTTAAEISMTKQYGDAQNALKTLPDLFVKNGDKKKSLEAEMVKACQSVKEDFIVDPQTGDPHCTPKMATVSDAPLVAPKVESKPEKK